MKFDQYGIPCGFEDIEHLPTFIESDEANSYLKQLSDKLPWQEITWRGDTGSVPRLVFRYGEFERGVRTYSVLERLLLYVEEVLETNVLGMWCNLYRNGEDHTPYYQDGYDSSIFTITLGAQRDFSIRKTGSASSQSNYSLKHGDAIYYASNINKTHEYAIPKSSVVNEPQISVLFFIDKPYSRRSNQLKRDDSLGFEDVRVWLGGPEAIHDTMTHPAHIRLPRGISESPFTDILQSIMIMLELENGDETDDED